MYVVCTEGFDADGQVVFSKPKKSPSIINLRAQACQESKANNIGYVSISVSLLADFRIDQL